MCRYNANGVLDKSFGYLGRVKTGFGDAYNSIVGDAVIQPDGKIILAGYHVTATTGGIGGDIAIARYNKEWKNIQEITALSAVTKRQNDSVFIFPNPAKNNLHLEGLPLNSKTILKITDYNGIVKMQAYTYNQSVNLNIASLKTGSYLLEIEINNTTIVKKFFKE